MATFKIRFRMIIFGKSIPEGKQLQLRRSDRAAGIGVCEQAKGYRARAGQCNGTARVM